MEYALKYDEIIKKAPVLLNRKQEADLLLATQKSRGKNREIAKEKLINFNYRLILKRASHYQHKTHLPIEDLVSAGLQGFVTAINNFSFRFNTKLSTSAVPWINLYILKLITSFNSPVYTPAHIINKRKEYKKIMDDEKSLPLTDKELMEELVITEKMLSNIKASYESSSVSLDADLSGDEEGRSVSEVVADTKIKLANVACEDKDDKMFLKQMVSTLDPISRNVITRRYLLQEKEDLRVVGKKLHITGERVRQIEEKALKLLRRRLKNRANFNIN